MNTIIFVTLFYLVVGVLAVALCRAASRGDKKNAEALLRARKSQQDATQEPAASTEASPSTGDDDNLSRHTDATGEAHASK